LEPVVRRENHPADGFGHFGTPPCLLRRKHYTEKTEF
jgi:hypothetical protein